MLQKQNILMWYFILNQGNLYFSKCIAHRTYTVGYTRLRAVEERNSAVIVPNNRYTIKKETRNT